MKKLNINSKKGFTIIEVVLVLAIAGLIFLMVFIALPNLQRTQRDTSRRHDLDRASSQLIQYVANNNKLPALDAGGAAQFVNGGSIVDDHTTTWEKFYWGYLLANGDDVFEDPDGGNYNLVAVRCQQDTANLVEINGIQRNLCTNNETKTTGDAALYLSPERGLPAGADSKYTMVIASNAMCGTEDTDNATIVYAEGTRKFAIALRLEGNGIYCVNN